MSVKFLFSLPNTARMKNLDLKDLKECGDRDRERMKRKKEAGRNTWNSMKRVNSISSGTWIYEGFLSRVSSDGGIWTRWKKNNFFSILFYPFSLFISVFFSNDGATQMIKWKLRERKRDEDDLVINWSSGSEHSLHCWLWTTYCFSLLRAWIWRLHLCAKLEKRGKDSIFRWLCNVCFAFALGNDERDGGDFQWRMRRESRKEEESFVYSPQFEKEFFIIRSFTDWHHEDGTSFLYVRTRNTT